MFLEIANQIIKLSFENDNDSHDILENVAIQYTATTTQNHDFEIKVIYNNNIEEKLKSLTNGPVRLNSNPSGTITVLSSNKFISHIKWTQKAMTVSIDTHCGQPDLLILENVKLLLSLICIQKGGLPCHSSALYKNDTAIAFVGNSGSGKSTIAHMLSTSWNLIDDDFNIFLPYKNAFYIHTTPFYIFKGIGEIPNKSPPLQLKRIFILKKSIITKMTPVSSQDKYIILMGNIFSFPFSDKFAQIILENCQRVCDMVPISNLFFSKTDDLTIKIDGVLNESY